MSWCYQDVGVEEKPTNVKIEYESVPIRHIAVQCPDCKNWFSGWDIIKSECRYSYQITMAECECPKCGSEFRIGNDSNIVDGGVAFPEFYDKCLHKKETWE